MKSAFDPKKVKGQVQLERINCAAHSIKTALVNSMNEKQRSDWRTPDEARPILNLLKDCKELVKHCRQVSIIRLRSKNLTTAVAARWNSNFFMIDSIVREYDIVDDLTTRNYDLPLEDFCRFLKRFHDATVALNCCETPAIHPWHTVLK